MLRAADAAQYDILPDACPKCHSGPPWLAIGYRHQECRRCGATMFLKMKPQDDGFVWGETPSQKTARLRRAAKARIDGMTPEAIQHEMAGLRARKAAKAAVSA